MRRGTHWQRALRAVLLARRCALNGVSTPVRPVTPTTPSVLAATGLMLAATQRLNPSPVRPLWTRGMPVMRNDEHSQLMFGSAS